MSHHGSVVADSVYGLACFLACVASSAPIHHSNAVRFPAEGWHDQAERSGHRLLQAMNGPVYLEGIGSARPFCDCLNRPSTRKIRAALSPKHLRNRAYINKDLIPKPNEVFIYSFYYLPSLESLVSSFEWEP